jgi:hypothetical protein
MGFYKRHNLISATHGALHITVSPLGIAGIYDLQNSLTACWARDGRLRIDRQDFAASIQRRLSALTSIIDP